MVFSSPKHVRRASGITAPLFFAMATACAAAPTPSPAPSRAAQSCSPRDRLRFGGAFLTSADGAAIWYRVAGPAGAPALLVVHGGPGYNSLTFERSAGAVLERNFRVIYVDQRGCGRSRTDAAETRFGLDATIDDLDRARAAAGAETVTLIGHSFGGIVAAAYIRRYRQHVRGFVAVDTTPFMGDALDHQAQWAVEHAEPFFPAEAATLRDAVASATTPFERVIAAYRAVGRIPFQRHLHFSSAVQQERMEAIDSESGLLACTRPEAVAAFVAEGLLDRHAEGSGETALGAPTLLVAGRSSEVIGRDNVDAAARAWGASIVWLDAGHFAYFEAPEAFAEVVSNFERR
jgi:proline iminopeptidase